MKTEVNGNGPWTFSITAMTRNANNERVPVGDVPMTERVAKHLHLEDYDMTAELQSGGHCFIFKAPMSTFEITHVK